MLCDEAVYDYFRSEIDNVRHNFPEIWIYSDYFTR